jgi:transcriptional regulator with XRE-family HTH domain
MSFGGHLRALRGKAGVSRAELARRAGVPVSTLRHWENGRCHATESLAANRDRKFGRWPPLLSLAAAVGRRQAADPLAADLGRCLVL